MVINLACPLDWVWINPERQATGTPVRDFLDQVLRGRKAYAKCGWHLLVTAPDTGDLSITISLTATESHQQAHQLCKPRYLIVTSVAAILLH